MHSNAPHSFDVRADLTAELKRLPLLQRSGLLDNPADRAFDRLTEFACRLLHTSPALITFFEADQEFLKSSHGLPKSKTTPLFLARIHELCRHVVTTNHPLIISEARFRAVQQATPDGFMIFESVRNDDGAIENFRWLYTNPAGERILGRSHAALIGKQLLVEMPGNRTTGLFDANVQVVESGNVWQHEFAYFYEGLHHWFRATAAKADDGFAVAITDITAEREAAEVLRRSEAELRRLNETLELRVKERTKELEERNRGLDQFAYVASHDLKAPLRAIANLASWIMEDAHDLLPLPSQDHLRKLRGRVVHMEKLLDDLLAYSRADRQRSTPESVDIGALVYSITDMIAPPEFTIVVTNPMPTAIVERVPLEATLRSLIGNAIKHHYHPHHGRVEVAAREIDGALEFTIIDNGPGIAAQFHDRIFAMFQTLQPRDKVEGSGMGLAIVKKMVESRGGTVTVSSREGAGAIFRFTWPKSGGEQVCR
ncbi:MAG: ATP-binding protein [Caldilineaceae bacterium]